MLADWSCELTQYCDPDDDAGAAVAHVLTKAFYLARQEVACAGRTGQLTGSHRSSVSARTEADLSAKS